MALGSCLAALRCRRNLRYVIRACVPVASSPRLDPLPELVRDPAAIMVNNHRNRSCAGSQFGLASTSALSPTQSQVKAVRGRKAIVPAAANRRPGRKVVKGRSGTESTL